MGLTSINFTTDNNFAASYPRPNDGAVLRFIVDNLVLATFDLFTRCGVPGLIYKR